MDIAGRLYQRLGHIEGEGLARFDVAMPVVELPQEVQMNLARRGRLLHGHDAKLAAVHRAEVQPSEKTRLLEAGVQHVVESQRDATLLYDMAALR